MNTIIKISIPRAIAAIIAAIDFLFIPLFLSISLSSCFLSSFVLFFGTSLLSSSFVFSLGFVFWFSCTLSFVIWLSFVSSWFGILASSLLLLFVLLWCLFIFVLSFVLLSFVLFFFGNTLTIKFVVNPP